MSRMLPQNHHFVQKKYTIVLLKVLLRSHVWRKKIEVKMFKYYDRR